MKIIDYQDSRPIYEQIAAYYRRMILMGVMETDEQMPSVRSLAIELSTNPNTVQKAYTALERDGYIYTVKGRGNFVKGRDELVNVKEEELVEKVSRLFQEANEMGLSYEDIVRKAEERMKND